MAITATSLLLALASVLLIPLQATEARVAEEIEQPEVVLTTSPTTTKPPYIWENDTFQIPPVNLKLATKHLLLASKYGLPSTDNLRLFNGFLLSYDRRLKGPAWVLERLTHSNLWRGADRSQTFFKEDANINQLFRVTNDDFRHSEYSRGHQAPAGDFQSSQVAMDQTFTLSNVVPQNRAQNSGGWVRLENYVRFLAKHPAVKALYVITGPLYRAKRAPDGKLRVEYEVIGPHHVAVPTHLFKVILAEHKDKRRTLELFVMPNTDEASMDIENIVHYKLGPEHLEEIEREAGVIFFDRLKRDELLYPSELQYDFIDRKFTFNN